MPACTGDGAGGGARPAGGGRGGRREARAALAAAQAEGHRLEAQAGRLEQDLDAARRRAPTPQNPRPWVPPFP